MDYTQLLSELDNPNRMVLAKQRLRVGMNVSYAQKDRPLEIGDAR